MVNSFNLRPLGRDDIEELDSLLSFLPELYPNGDTWLATREQQILEGNAYAVVAELNGEIVAALLGKDKGDKGFKISTLYVQESYRGQGIGKALLRAALRDNLLIIRERGAYITVPVNENYHSLDSLLVTQGFSLSLSLSLSIKKTDTVLVAMSWSTVPNIQNRVINRSSVHK